MSNPTYDEPEVHTPAMEALSTFQAQFHALVAQRNHTRIQGPFSPTCRGDAFPFEDHICQLNQIAQLMSSVKTHAIDEIAAQREMLLATIQEECTQLFLDKQQWLAQHEPIPDNKATTSKLVSVPFTHPCPQPFKKTARQLRFSTNNSPQSSHHWIIIYGHHYPSPISPYHKELQLYSEGPEDAALFSLFEDLSSWNTCKNVDT
ncbi:hypothetical protein K439DRAFT_1148950 [Ramaria rubella]|nr:hypothetical protein K439DRAFT_1148950 [Ramaria rubella]